MLEVVYYALPVEKVHGRSQKVPIQGPRKSQVFCFTRHVGDGNDLLERYNLDASDDGDEVQMAREHCREEATNHDKSPYRSGNEICLFLLIF